MGFAHEYAAAVLHRSRVPMDPVDFEPDWADQPRDGRHFPGAERFALPGRDPVAEAAGATVQSGLTGPRGDRPFTLPLLGAMLQDSCGLLSRRLAVHANVSMMTMPSYQSAGWSRGSASGGGLYPVGVHWVSGPSGPLAPGVYHYSAAHHAMRRLLAGDVSAEVGAALSDERLGDTDQFLILGVKFWQNSFKYNSFCYHVVAMDVGAVLQTWRMWARAQGLHIGPALWFDESRLSRLLGLDPEKEGLFAVVPLRWKGARAAPTVTTPAAARVRHADQERSRTVYTFDLLERMQAAALEGATERPAAGALTTALARPVAAGGERTPLPEPLTLPSDLRTSLRARRSSFGRFSSYRTVDPAQLSAILAAAEAAGRLDSDVEPPDGPSLTRLYVFVNHVESVAPGSYLYDPLDRSLRLVRSGAPGSFVQRAYTLNNYNVEQAGAVIVPTVRTSAVLDALGDRGYRLAAAAVGATAQAVYTACAAMDLGCGVALGFDGDSYVEELALAGSAEMPLLSMMVGHERPHPADFRYEIA
ncbi:SagB-type dehydrogenase family enzyme [Streptacidiphilus sp. MAP12-16]|uniref:SagB family peptide dehydrogenase n=1 Tax=Streptacidiphilus sp. MAP12-16 TaxID=3156300 RepID=UPI0035163F78